jgi:hypothetical protein
MGARIVIMFSSAGISAPSYSVVTTEPGSGLTVLKYTVLVLLDDLPVKWSKRPLFEWVAKLSRSLGGLLAVHTGQRDVGDEAVELTAYILQLEAAGMARERSSGHCIVGYWTYCVNPGRSVCVGKKRRAAPQPDFGAALDDPVGALAADPA